VLELHMIRDDEADQSAGAAAASPVNGDAPLADAGTNDAARGDSGREALPASGEKEEPEARNAHGTRRMEPRELREFLASQRWAILATANGAQPYAVPVAYGYDGRDFFVATGPGRKAAAIRENPGVCLTIVDIRPDGKSWRSAVVTGRAEWIGDLRGRIAAFSALRRQAGSTLPRTPAALLEAARAGVLRIVAHEVTGRVKDPT